MNIRETSLNGLQLIEPDQYHDERGFFLETYQRARYLEAGIDVEFVQDNHSHSSGGVLKGMHYTIKAPQSMLVYVSSGSIFDVVVDLRLGSPTYGEWHGVDLGPDPAVQLFIPAGFAHGFYVTGDHADVHYKVTHYYDSSDEGGFNCNDPEVGIEWPASDARMIQRDREYPNLSELSDEKLSGVRYESDTNV